MLYIIKKMSYKNTGMFFEQNEQTPWTNLKQSRSKGWKFMVYNFYVWEVELIYRNFN